MTRGWAFTALAVSGVLALGAYRAVLANKKNKKKTTTKKSGLRIVIFGAPASGKGTQCKKLVEAFDGLMHISTGDILRAEVEAGSALGRKAKRFMDAGQLVPDDIMVPMLAEVMRRCPRGWLLDGMPRTAAQADAMTEMGLVPDVFIVLDVSEEALILRVTGRRLDPITGDIYHLTFKPPPPGEVAERVTQRSDDTEAKLQKRIGAYRTNLAEVMQHYVDHGVLERIEGETGGADAVFTRVLAALTRKLAGI
jgi:adenylate kinase